MFQTAMSKHCKPRSYFPKGPNRVIIVCLSLDKMKMNLTRFDEGIIHNWLRCLNVVKVNKM